VEAAAEGRRRREETEGLGVRKDDCCGKWRLYERVKLCAL